MRTVRLYGKLAKFGKSFRLDVRSAAEAIKALCVQIPGFENHLRVHSAPGYRVHVGKHKGVSRDELTLESEGDVSIVPVLRGAGGNNGVLQAILGVVLIAVSFFVPATWAIAGVALKGAIAGTGISMVLGGVAQMLVRPPKLSQREGPEKKPSYSLDGPVNTVAQTNPVPICYGELIIGSHNISGAIVTEELPV